MRHAIILALVLAACTGKNAAKGTVEYVPVVPLAALQGAGGDDEADAGADAEVAGENGAGGAGGAGGEIVEADAGPEADAGEVDAGAPVCVETAWTDDRRRGIDEAEDLFVDCRQPCAVLTACALYYLDENNKQAACPCLTSDDSPRIYDECLLRCITGGEPERFFSFGRDGGACDEAAMERLARLSAVALGDGLVIACHGGRD